ncbi:Diphthamide biosynthesis protein [Taphrina deformans PYCC 5710]|uniref:Diphthamide biosynthesis protein n=1 Tax=Taphrina deformans (strain PYCC 5710 / ATCC 11124 / CBS 356.35 / IMI 108563 / JCM 9778 / NBRC 8474) TaxID=1097556 RepID=R4XBT2_TAPDE|nr:Diphthamide biosynthesis protein [Taphrina deformans PYCC 5710]|eukprot:CCG81836.1 Diphthamide biosynthesis protein [Taphrina deformans PYCC 5710]
MLVSEALRVLELPHGDIDAARLKKAYHGKLLAAHPDKQGSSTVRDCTGQCPSIDDVREAYLCLLHAAVSAKEDGQGYSVVDLDDFEYVSDAIGWTLPCRCGHGYHVTESDLEQGRDVVGCDGCSLFVRVTYQENTEDE